MLHRNRARMHLQVPRRFSRIRQFKQSEKATQKGGLILGNVICPACNQMFSSQIELSLHRCKPIVNENRRASKMGSKNPMWKGDKATKSAGYSRAHRKFRAPKGKECHHKDGNPLNNDPSNIEIATRKEHMILDGRLGFASKFRDTTHDEEMRVRYLAGQGLKMIGKALNVSDITVLNHLKTMGVQRCSRWEGRLQNRNRLRGEQL